jgi:hypothetical protein
MLGQIREIAVSWMLTSNSSAAASASRFTSPPSVVFSTHAGWRDFDPALVRDLTAPRRHERRERRRAGEAHFGAGRGCSPSYVTLSTGIGGLYDQAARRGADSYAVKSDTSPSAPMVPNVPGARGCFERMLRPLSNAITVSPPGTEPIRLCSRYV